MEKNEIISSGLLELFVLGMANEQEAAQVLAMAAQYPEVKAELASIESSLELYAHANAVSPAASVKNNILAEIKRNDNTSSVSASAKVIPVSSFWKYAAAASIILLIGSAILNINYYNKYENANNERLAAVKDKSDAEQRLLSQEQAADQIKSDMSVMKSDMNVVQSKYSEPVALHGLPAAPDAAAKIFWMKNTGDVYIDPSNLPDAPSGMQYQLWAIVDGKPVDGGMIITTQKQDKYHIQKMKSFGKADAFAVTLETAGGNTTPKGKMYVMGKKI